MRPGEVPPLYGPYYRKRAQSSSGPIQTQIITLSKQLPDHVGTLASQLVWQTQSRKRQLLSAAALGDEVRRTLEKVSRALLEK